MSKMIRLSEKERRKLWLSQSAAETVVDILVTKAQQALAAVDPDLPRDVQETKRQRIRAELRDKVGPQLAELRGGATLASGQAALYTRAAVLRRAAMEAPSAVTLLAQHATPGQLAVLAAEAAADGNFTLSGAVAWAMAGKTMSPAEAQAIAVELDAAQWPDLSAVEETLRDARDASLRAELAVEAVAPGRDGALRKMELGRQLKAPVLAPLEATVAGG